MMGSGKIRKMARTCLRTGSHPYKNALQRLSICTVMLTAIKLSANRTVGSIGRAVRSPKRRGTDATSAKPIGANHEQNPYDARYG